LVCATCGRDNPETSAFCTGCGARLSPANTTASAPPPPPAAAPSSAAASIPDQLLRSWMPLVYLLIAGYFDYIAHRQWGALLLMGGAAVGAILYRRAIYAFMRPLNQLIPERWFPVLLAGVPGLLYFLTRGSGTLSSSGVLLIVLMLGALIFGLVTRGEAVDKALQPWYEFRDRLLPKVVRLVAPPFLAVFLSFAIAQGTLGDFDAMFGGKTDKAAIPSTSKILIATLLTVAVTFLLAREKPDREREA
jgi:hypothetical protein